MMMEEDRLLRFHERLRDFLQKNLPLFLNLVGILALLILLGFGYNYYNQKKNEKAFKELFSLLNQGGKPELLLSFAERQGSTEAGKLALLLLWNSALSKEDQKLIQVVSEKLEKSLSSHGKTFIKYAQAKVLESEGQIDAALKTFEGLLKDDTSLKEFIYLDLIRIKSVRRDKKGARLLAEEYLKHYGNSSFAGFVSAKLKEFGGS